MRGKAFGHFVLYNRFTIGGNTFYLRKAAERLILRIVGSVVGCGGKSINAVHGLAIVETQKNRRERSNSSEAK